MTTWVVTLHLLAIAGMALFAFHRLRLLFWLVRPARRPTGRTDESWQRAAVCVQCPLFNEPEVVEGLLHAVSQLRWQGPVEIQILDDSTDQTPEIIQAWIARQNPEVAGRFRHLRRPNRAGFKAGALAYGMEFTQAPFLAIFDADFRPAPDFLERMMPSFDRTDIGVVQARWDYSNRRRSFLTYLQGVFLDAHFVLEQEARHRAGYFMNFNGTAGIWRRAALEAGGGWQPDTVTEDLDASYRTQMAGWRFVFRRELGVLSELPENLSAFKSQQRRWTKGGIQVARKLLPDILSRPIGWDHKLESCLHLGVNSIYGFLLVFALTLVPFHLVGGPALCGYWSDRVLQLAGAVAIASYAWSQWARTRRLWPAFLVVLASPLLMILGLALCVTCAAAAFEGLVQRGGEFVRTPKGAGKKVSGGLLQTARARGFFWLILLVELALGLGMLFGGLRFWDQKQHLLGAIIVAHGCGFFFLATGGARDLLSQMLRSVRAS